MSGIELIAAERDRQINEEGWSAEHDAEHAEICLAVAGACYALDVASRHTGEHESWKSIYAEPVKRLWPFDLEWFKPTVDDPVRQLVKAGALIAAEIDRILKDNKEGNF